MALCDTTGPSPRLVYANQSAADHVEGPNCVFGANQMSTN